MDKHPAHPMISAAVAPLRDAAAADARGWALTRILECHTEMQLHGWDLQKAAPYPSSRIGAGAYHSALAKHNRYSAILGDDPARPRSNIYGAPHYTVASPEDEERYIQAMVKMAIDQYEAYVDKLCLKLTEGGDVEHAALERRTTNVWVESFLQVTRKGGTVERWKTQRIFNTSKHGLPFQQFPTRKVK